MNSQKSSNYYQDHPPVFHMTRWEYENYIRSSKPFAFCFAYTDFE